MNIVFSYEKNPNKMKNYAKNIFSKKKKLPDSPNWKEKCYE